MLGFVLALALLSMLGLRDDTILEAVHLTGNPATYTLDADFDEGTLINVNHDSPNNDQLQLNGTTTPFGFIWVAASARGTIVKIDTETGDVLGEYQSAPNGRGLNPSRTTVDANGNVWAGNRDESTGGKGSVVQVGLQQNGQCEDRHGLTLADPPDSVIQTSSGLGDILSWDNAGAVDDNGGVTTAYDECIIKYVRVAGDNVRHVSVDENNNVWTGGTFGSDNAFDLVEGATGAILASFDVGCGGYGGLVDGSGVLWSASRAPFYALLRYDTMGTVTTTDDSFACLGADNSYGLGIDSGGNIWHSQYTNNSILKFDPLGSLFAGFPKSTFGATGDRGVAVTQDDDNVWVANSHGFDVSRLDNDGNLVDVIGVGNGPTGVAVDAAGKVWATNLNSNDVSRINPATNLVDLTVDLGAGAGPYNYSDMTGSIVPAAPTNGTWTIIHDTGIDGAEWGTVSWTSDEPEAAVDGGDASLTVTAESSDDGVTFSTTTPVANGVDLGLPDGRYLRVNVSFTRSDGGDTPVLFDLTIEATAPETPSPSGRVYKVTVFPSFGGHFQDCLRFGADGSLTVDLLGSGSWQENFSGPHFAWWLAMAGPDPSFFIRLSGVTFHDDGTRLRAFGQDNNEPLPATFSIKGSENPACSVGLDALGATWSQ